MYGSLKYPRAPIVNRYKINASYLAGRINRNPGVRFAVFVIDKKSKIYPYDLKLVQEIIEKSPINFVGVYESGPGYFVTKDQIREDCNRVKHQLGA